MQALNLDPITAWHVATEQTRERARDPQHLLDAARRLLDELPPGELSVLTRNDESAAVVGAAIALEPVRSDELSWRPIVMGRHEKSASFTSTAFVEVGELGAGLCGLIHDRYPGVTIIDQLISSNPRATNRVLEEVA